MLKNYEEVVSNRIYVCQPRSSLEIKTVVSTKMVVGQSKIYPVL